MVLVGFEFKISTFLCPFRILPVPGKKTSVKNFAQGKIFDPVDFLNLHEISFPVVYNTSLSKFFPLMTLFLLNSTGLHQAFI